MQRCREHNIKLNKDKVKLPCEEVPFLGYLISKDGLKADAAKIKPVLEMPSPADVASVCRFLGFTNYLGKSTQPRVNDLCEPFRKLTLPDVGWFWTNLQEVKTLVTNAPVHKYFDSSKGITLHAVRRVRLGAWAVLIARRPPHCVSKPRAERSRNSLCADRERAPCSRLWTGEVPHLHVWEISNCGIGSQTIRSDR